MELRRIVFKGQLEYFLIHHRILLQTRYWHYCALTVLVLARQVLAFSPALELALLQLYRASRPMVGERQRIKALTRREPFFVA